MLKLFFSPGSIARASLITLYEVEADFEAVRVDFSKAEQTQAAYREINPKGRVPALVTEQGIVTETPAILVYLAHCYPEANLLPEGPFAFAQLQSFHSYLASTVHVNHAHRFRGARWADQESSFEDMRQKVPETMLSSMRLIEEALLQGPWVFGEHYTVADAYLFTVSSWLDGDGVDVSQLPRVMAHHRRMQARSAVAAALAREAAE